VAPSGRPIKRVRSSRVVGTGSPEDGPTKFKMFRTLLLACFSFYLIAVSAVVDAAAQIPAPRPASAGEALRNSLIDGPISNPEALIAVLQSQITTFPIGSSAGGFTWGFDQQLGIQVRRSRSFGPMFADRPHTNGRFRLSVNLAHQRNEWKGLAGEDLAEGLMTWFISDPSDGFTGHPEGFFSITKMTLKTDRTVIGATFGVSDRIDVGVVFPYGHSYVAGSTDLTITDLQTDRVVISEHYKSAGESSGIGDFTVRGKVNVLNRGSFALAAGADLRLPTGSQDKLLGSGGTQTRLMAIGSFTRNDATPHFNIGYTFAPGQNTSVVRRTQRPEEFNYVVGADIAINTNVTVAGDLSGRTLIGATEIFRETIGIDSSLYAARTNVHLLIGAIGAKVLIGKMWLVTASLAFPLTDNGVKPGITPVLGFERAF
jgi:hypothetical protein